MAINYVYFLCLRQHAAQKTGRGSGRDYVILLSQRGGWVLVTVDYTLQRGEGCKKCQKMIT